jgi:hypothetical protein
MKQTRVVLASWGEVRSHSISFAENDPESREETDFFRLFNMGLCMNTKRANAFQKKIVGHRKMQVSRGPEFAMTHGCERPGFFGKVTPVFLRKLLFLAESEARPELRIGLL